MSDRIVKVSLTALLLLSAALGCSRSSVSPERIVWQQNSERPQSGADAGAESAVVKNSIAPTAETSVVLDAPLIRQKPQLRNGCEVTSLAMLLQYAGVDIGKMELASQVRKDPDPLKQARGWRIRHWGNPNHGFVGDITGREKGYGVYHQPLRELMERYLPGPTEDLTGSSFEVILQQVSDNRPVLVWTTSHFSKPAIWNRWVHRGQPVQATFEEHAVLLVGFDRSAVYINDPLTGRKAERVNRKRFVESWTALGQQALTYR